jgi:hypothetical protein
MRLTLDTSCVIDAAQAQPRGPQVDELVDLARHRRVGLWITEAFTVDQETAPADRHQRNLAWLSARPVIGRIPGPWRLGYSGLKARRVHRRHQRRRRARPPRDHPVPSIGTIPKKVTVCARC